jgi:structure-specific endonuclease subunit SLX1
MDSMNNMDDDRSRPQFEEGNEPITIIDTTTESSMDSNIQIEDRSEHQSVSECKYYCYIIANDQDRTYNGYTTNLSRRLRQHNGEICGGARATHNRGPWRYVAILTSLGWKDISTAMKHEWTIKYPTRKRPRPKQFNGVSGRLDSLVYAVKEMSHSGEIVHCFIDTKHNERIDEKCCSLYDFIKVYPIATCFLTT